MGVEITKTGYSWLYDATRAKISDKLRKEGADPELLQRFFNKIDTKKKCRSGKICEVGKGAFEDRVLELLDKKKITALEDVKKKAPGYAKKVKVVVKYKNDTIQLLIDGNKIVSAP